MSHQAHKEAEEHHEHAAKAYHEAAEHHVNGEPRDGGCMQQRRTSTRRQHTSIQLMRTQRRKCTSTGSSRLSAPLSKAPDRVLSAMARRLDRMGNFPYRAGK
jgi:hypothetical protein